MNAWPPDPLSLPNGNHAGFPPSNDPSMNFLQSPNTIDPSQFQNQRFLNGTPRNASPAGFHQPSYQVNPIIPTKRPRDKEDSLGASPRPAPGGLPGSRSHTPAQNQFAGYHPGANGTPGFPPQPTPYQHLQNAPQLNVTPSPNAQTQHFNQPGSAQRVQTASPSPFSPHGGPQMSPAHESGRVPTPHENPNLYMQPGPYGPGMPPQPYGNPQGMQSGQMPMNPHFNPMAQQMQGQGMTPQQRAFQMQMQAQARQMHAQNRPSSSGMPPGAMPNAMMNPQVAAMQMQQQIQMQQQHPQHPQQQQQMQGIPKTNPEHFVKQIQTFMAQRGQPVDLNPVIFGRPINPLQLYGMVLKAGGSRAVSKANQWSMMATQLHFPQMQLGPAAAELQKYWAQNLGPYEHAWMASKQHQKQEQMRSTSQGQIPNQISPPKGMNIPGHDPMAQFQHGAPPVQNGMKAMQQNMPPNQAEAAQNGPQIKDPSRASTTPNQNRQSISRQTDPSQANGYPMPSPAKRLDGSAGKDTAALKVSTMPPKEPIEDPFHPAIMPESSFHGPVNVQEIFAAAEAILSIKPNVPSFREMGLVDIHALIMSIKSGIHAEVRLALDMLTIISCEHHVQLSLGDCDDLVETLIDCAQDQLDLLAEHATEVSDEIDLLSYEEVVRGCRTEAESLPDVPEFASVEYDLDRSADRLICITTLLRNFSFYEANFGTLGTAEVIKFMTTVIRYLGTRNMLLRSNRNTLDFMKDCVIFLSNLSHAILLPSKDEAACLLHFLLAFAPCPSPVSNGSDQVFFASYNPQVHKYMPSAVDSLAKLLARDDPNRTYYKSIFVADAGSHPPYALLTRAFGLAIAPIPESNKGNLLATVESRKPFILQGMLAAEILSGLGPGTESGLARSWLESTDGFAVGLLRLVCMLSSKEVMVQAIQKAPAAGRMGMENNEPAVYAAISHRGLTVLRRLAEKSKTDDNRDVKLPVNVLPKRESLLGALLTPEIDPFIVRQLCIYGMEE